MSKTVLIHITAFHFSLFVDWMTNCGGNKACWEVAINLLKKSNIKQYNWIIKIITAKIINQMNIKIIIIIKIMNL